MIELKQYSKLEKSNQIKITRNKESTFSKFITVSAALTLATIVFVSVQICLTPQEPINYNLRLYEQESETEAMKAYLNFLATYGRQYASQDEHANRYRIFKDNYESITKHNDLGSIVPFEREINQFADMTFEEIEATFLGIRLPWRKQDKYKAEDYAHSVLDKVLPWVASKNKLEIYPFDKVAEGIPEEVNWYEAGKVSRPYDQKACGSCWAFTTAATLESLAAIKGIDQTLQEYSVQQLIDCDSKNFGCQGGWMFDAFQYTQNQGIALKSDYQSYTPRQGSCNYEASKIHFKNTGMKEVDGLTNAQLKELVSKQPVGVGMFASGMLASYKRGVITEDFLKCSHPSREVNHGVTVVGYGKVKEGDTVRGWCKEYWVVRNSWGANWGEEGFFKLCMDNAGLKSTPLGTCLINKYATYPTLE